MKLDIALQEFYPHAIAKVWAALTDSAALTVWLMMPNDFEPKIGKHFTFRGPKAGSRGRIECEVLVLEPPSRMVWSWSSTDEGVPTRVEFRLESIEGGTRLILEHTGETDAETRSRLTHGWQIRLLELQAELTRQSN